MKLIDKDALVVEIESKFQKYWKMGEKSDALQDGNAKYWGGVLSCLNEVKTLVDTLEVKEVDFGKEINDSMPSKYCWSGDGEAVYTKEQMVEFAKHFFELGISVSNSTKVTTPDVDDVLKENGVNPDSKEAKIIKESYFMAIEKLAQKGK